LYRYTEDGGALVTSFDDATRVETLEQGGGLYKFIPVDPP
jgi:hypothetical protein